MVPYTFTRRIDVQREAKAYIISIRRSAIGKFHVLQRAGQRGRRRSAESYLLYLCLNGYAAHHARKRRHVEKIFPCQPSHCDNIIWVHIVRVQSSLSLLFICWSGVSSWIKHTMDRAAQTWSMAELLAFLDLENRFYVRRSADMQCSRHVPSS